MDDTVRNVKKLWILKRLNVVPSGKMDDTVKNVKNLGYWLPKAPQ